VRAALSRHFPFFCVFGLALLLHLYGLGWLPSPAGDEGNWALYGWRMLQGQPVALAPDAAFVSLLYARLIAAVMAVLGPTFAAARLVGTTAVLAAVVLVYVMLGWLGSWRAGLAAAAVLAIHPWAVMYGRTASTPYSLALGMLTVGPVCFAAGLVRRRPWLAAAGVLLTSVGIHFSPLALVAVAACGSFALWPAHRWILRRPELWAAAVLGAAHSAFVLLGAARVAQAAPDLPQLSAFWPHLGSYLHMTATGLMGEATLRHFTSYAMPPYPALVLVLPLLLAVALDAMPGDRPRILGGFAETYLVAGVVLTPFILAPGRNWYLPANHMDRYLFTVLPGFALVIGELAARKRRLGTVLVLAIVAWLGLGATARGAWAYLRAGGVDHGEGIFDGGGGYRGWLVSDQHRATMLRIRDRVQQEVGPGGAAILVADRVFIPLVFAMEGTGIPVHDVRRTPIPPRADGRYFVVLWPDAVLSLGHPPTASPKYVESNRVLRERMERVFRRRLLVETFRQPDGSPLLELWRAEDPLPRLQLPDRREDHDTVEGDEGER
jgi:hypothetical protein